MITGGRLRSSPLVFPTRIERDSRYNLTMATEADRRLRANTRRERMTLRLIRSNGDDIEPSGLRGAEAVSLVAELTRRAWALSGRQGPTYRREDMPVTLMRRG